MFEAYIHTRSNIHAQTYTLEAFKHTRLRASNIHTRSRGSNIHTHSRGPTYTGPGSLKNQVSSRLSRMLQNTYRNQGLDTLFGPGKISEFWASNIHARGLQTYTLESFKHTH